MEYDANDFVTRNTIYLDANTLELFSSSSNSLVRSIFNYRARFIAEHGALLRLMQVPPSFVLVACRTGDDIFCFVGAHLRMIN